MLGDIGLPWRMPLEGLKLYRDSPLTRMEMLVVEIQLIMRFTK